MKILLIMALFSVSIWAEDYKITKKDCSPTDVRDHHPNLRDHFSRPQDQDSIGWCYGYAAADLLSVETGEPVSAIHVSTIFNKKIAESSLWKFGYSIGNLFMENTFSSVYEGGYIRSAVLDAMKNKSVCSDKDLPYYTDYSSDIHGLIKSIEIIKRQLKEEALTETKACEIIEDRLERSIFSTKRERDKILASLIYDDLNVALEKLIRTNCEDRKLSLSKKKVRELSKPHRRGRDRHASREYLSDLASYKKEVNDVLSKGSPLGISYNVKYVTPMNGNHASTVIARRWENGRCEYKIRNSWGQSCHSYQSDIECNGSEGSFWVDDEKFFKMASGLTYIDG